MIRDIINTEIAYSKCFSQYEENDQLIRFIDKQLEDMYTHNYSLIKGEISEKLLYQLILKEIAFNKKNNKKFLQIDFHSDIDSSFLKRFEVEPELTVYEYYYILVDDAVKLSGNKACTIERMNTQEHIKESLELDIRANGSDMGESFIKKRFSRRVEVYKLANQVEHYLGIYNSKYIGHADLFVNDQLGKIEDFDVESTFQRQGFGTSILKSLIQKTKLLNGKIAYVLTDKDDTAREMYKKCGFTKIGQKYSLLFSF